MARAKTLTFTNPDSNQSVRYEIADATVGAVEFSSVSAYSAGDYCVYNNTLYRCISAVTAGSEFDDTKWTATSIANEVSALNPVVYCTCETGASTKAKVADPVDFASTTFILKTGTKVLVKFTNSNTASSPTLNVAGTGAKAIRRYGTTAAGTNAATSWVAGAVVQLVYDGTTWIESSAWDNNDNIVPQAQCETAADTAAKVGTITNFSLLSNSFVMVNMRYANSAASALTLNLNSTGAKPIFINGAASSESSYTLPAGSYFVYYDGTNFYFRTDGKITASITGNAATVNGLTVQTAVPANAKFTDTTYTFTQNASDGHKITLTPSSGSATTLTIPDNNTTYTLSQDASDGHKITLTPSSGSATTLTIPDNNTTYTLTQNASDGHKITLTPSSGSATTLTIPDNNTTYTLTQDASDGHKITLTPSTGSATTITIPDNNTTYESKAAASGGTAVSLVTTGEKYTWNNKIGSHQTIKQEGVTGATINRFGTCDIAAGTAAKTVSLTSGTFALEAGARVTVKFANKNTASSPTLNVGGTGAKNIFHNGAQITSGGNKAMLYGTVDFVYDGTQYHLVGNYIDTNTNTTYTLTQDASDGHKITLTPSSGSATTITIPDNNTTYSSKAAASGGTDVSLVTTGEKYTWNSKTSNTGTVTKVSTGVGLTGGDVTTSGTVKAKLKSETASTLDSASMGSTSDRQYAVGVDKSGYLSVNIPWQNDNTTYSAGAGMTLSSTTFKAKLKSETASTLDSASMGSTSDRQYAVGIDKSGYLSVNIPWQNDNTTYSAGTGLSLSGTKFNHSNSVTAGTAGTSSATSGSTLAVPYVTYDAQGHVTASGTHTHTVSGFLTSHQTIKQDGVTGATVNRYGASSTAAGTAAKTVSVSTGTFSLEAGARVTVKFNNANTASSPTLNVNSTGAKNIFHKGAQVTSGGNKALLAGVCDFIYDGTQYHLIGNYIDTNTTYTASTTSVGSASAGTAIAADDITGWTTNTPTAVTKKTVVTGGSTTAIPNISKKTVVTSASGATATYSAGILTITNGSFSTGDSVTVGTAINAYTSLTTGDSVSVTEGTAASLSYTARSIPNISVTNKTVATGITAS